MHIFHLIFFISIFLLTNAQWYIKKSDRAKLMSYPNPGKRNLADEVSTYIQTDCSIPYSQLHSYQQKTAWIVMCNYPKSELESNEETFAPDWTSMDIELPSTATLQLPIKRSAHVVPPYFKEDNVSFNRLMMKMLRRMVKNR